MKVLVSVYNISGYLMASLGELRKSAEIAILQRDCCLTPKEGEAAWNEYRWLSRDQLASSQDVLTSLGDWRPDIFICGGWADRVGLDLARYYHQVGVCTVLCCDTPWENRPKQWINCVLARFLFVWYFNFAWVAGPSQRRYMRLIGFRAAQIREGYYSADAEKFAALYQPNRHSLPHVFIFVGRYISVKNIERMQDAFLAAIAERPTSDWRLKMIGEGDLWESRRLDPRIEHLGYCRPSEIQDSLQDIGCFVLPSLREPWGVVVHEFALAGLPMICSRKVEASKMFLREGENGFLFDPCDIDEMKAAFLKIMDLSDKTLVEMGEQSHKRGLLWTNRKWADCAIELARGHNGERENETQR